MRRRESDDSVAAAALAGLRVASARSGPGCLTKHYSVSSTPSPGDTTHRAMRTLAPDQQSTKKPGLGAPRRRASPRAKPTGLQVEIPAGPRALRGRAAISRGRKRALAAAAAAGLLAATASLVALVALDGVALGARGAEATEQVLFKYNEQERGADFWLKSGRSALEQALRHQPVAQRAKSAVVFVGDGMSLTTITAARILYGQLLNKSGEEEQLAFERLQHVALVKTYNVDQQVPDSAATATAILCGVKANFYTLGVNANVRLNDTNCAKIQANQVHSILKQAQDAGKATGIITNTRITHATPAAAYAHVSNRRWECDSYVPRSLDPACKDIARQLVEDEPGNRLNVIMGGGRRCFFGPSFVDPGPGNHKGIRLDDRNLIDQWLEQRRANNERNFAFVNSTQDLRSVDVDKTDYLLGLFSFNHMNYEEMRDPGPFGEPSLSEMTETAIRILSKNPNGYLLLVEGGRIDHAHHENVAGVALRETIALSWAVQAARNMVDPRDTLLAVTSDHAHALTMNGLAPRGNPILGLSRFKENATQLPYTTLLYGNGPGNQRPRPDPSVGPNSTDSPYYVQFAAVHQEEAFHDGSDVAVFAAGPFAHLFQGVQEQSYIAHVFAYALCIGDYAHQPHCDRPAASLAGNPIPGAADQSAEASSRAASVAGEPNPSSAAPGGRLMGAPPSRYQQSHAGDCLPGGSTLFKRSAASRPAIGGLGFASLSVIFAAIMLLIELISSPTMGRGAAPTRPRTAPAAHI